MDYWLNLCSLVQILFYMVDAGRTSKVVVKTNIGPIQGFKVLAGSSEVAVFRGIPYAEAPIGNRRFKPPVPISEWNKVLITSDYGNICIQSSSSTDNQTYVGDEDCLTLNIFKPMLFKKENKNIPVIVMIHTGNFISGSSKDVNGVELAKSLESIVVTLNYRLGILGFYSMDGHIKENIGVLDQITALKWITSNIQDFNGNPENILLIADQITSSIHLMSPLSRVLFSRAISYDGESYLNPISSYNFNFGKHRSHLEKICGPINTSGQLPVEHIVWVCLRKLSTVDLVDLSRDLVDHVLWHPFRPVYDDDVIRADSHIHSSFLHCDYMAFKSNLILPALLNRNENNTSCEDIFKFAISDIAEKRFSNNKALVKAILMSNYFPQFSNSSYDFCKAIEPLMNDAITSDIISFANHHSRTGLTFVNFASIGNHAHASTLRTHRIQSRDMACILTNQNADSCHLPDQESVGINNIVRTFLYHGYPTVNPETVWRPYTTTSKNYLQTTNTTFVTGDSANWPLEKMERLWLDVLLDVGTSKSFASEPDIKVINEAFGLNWGLSEPQGAAKTGRRAQQSKPLNPPDAPDFEASVENSPQMAKSKRPVRQEESDEPPKPSRVSGWGEDNPRKSRKLGEGFENFEDDVMADIDDIMGERLRPRTPEDDNDSDTDIPVIPDLEEQQDDDIQVKVAIAPNVAVNRVATYRELDNDLLRQAAFTTLDNDIDLKLLTKNLSTEADLIEEDKPWDWDRLFTEVTSELLSQIDSIEETNDNHEINQTV